MTFPSDDKCDGAIPEWETKIGKHVNKDEHLSTFFSKSSRDAGFFFDEDHSIVIGAKLARLDNKITTENTILDNGNIIVSCKWAHKEKLTKIMSSNFCDNYWIAIQGKSPNENSSMYTFRGYYKYVGMTQNNEKFIVSPIEYSSKNHSSMNEKNSKKDISPPLSDESGSSEEEVVPPSKKRRSNMRVVHDIEPSISLRPFYSGHRYDSLTEARYAVFLNYFQIPFKTQVSTGVLSSSINYKEYVIDYFVNCPKGAYYIEVKPVRPSEEEERLCEEVTYSTQLPTYLVYGKMDVPHSIENTFVNNYTAIKYEYVNGIVQRDEGYSFFDRSGFIIMDKRRSVSDRSFYTKKLKEAYEYVRSFEFSV